MSGSFVSGSESEESQESEPHVILEDCVDSLGTTVSESDEIRTVLSKDVQVSVVGNCLLYTSRCV